MCVSELQKGIYPLAKEGSRSVAELGRALGWDGLKNEGKKGEENPGYALTRAAESAGLAAGAVYGPGMYASLMSSPEAYAAVTPGLTAGSEQAAMLAAQTGDFGAQGLLSTSAAGGNPLANMVAGSSGGVTGKGGLLATQMGLKMMQPQQPQQHLSPPPQQAPMTPLPNPYGNPSGNSLGTNNMDEATKRRLRAMGYPV